MPADLGSLPDLPDFCGHCRKAGHDVTVRPHAAEPIEDGAARVSWKCWRCGHAWQGCFRADALAGPGVQVIAVLDSAFARSWGEPWTGLPVPSPDDDDWPALLTVWPAEAIPVGRPGGWQLMGTVAMQFGETNIRAELSPAAARELARLLCENADASEARSDAA